MVKACALKKMADLFRRWMSELKSTFVDRGKTPEFTGRFEKIRDHWPAFVAYKTSDKSKKMSETNKDCCKEEVSPSHGVRWLPQSPAAMGQS